ncbi:hypothetical protein TOPH_02445 [Tolypocladium ophioglossoides CBS 100239]|uniref:Uncharacterized protein n=1 Tax=Tolypocladium ophioglossoides (strain CBS 100239) TaxID=1163406 RepID=A0A0L0NFW3_TOLOC|nr:hypothetical protein TOPH_02445 [Tolypocladium ophioglossoides CBS 100239]
MIDRDLNRPATVARPPSIYSPEPPPKSFAMGSIGPAGKAAPPPPMTSFSRRLSYGSFSAHHTAVKHRRGLTAVPIMLSTVAGVVSSVSAKFWGKRPLYLASAVLLIISSIWNMMTGDSYGSCMGARVFQGLGWGAFDTLVMGSIQDTYFVSPTNGPGLFLIHQRADMIWLAGPEHERNLPVSLFNVFTIATTWASPLVGGVASTNAGSFSKQFRIICGFYALAIPLLALGAPETAFDRSTTAITPSPVPGMGGFPRWRLRHRLNKETLW